ncbi:MAG: hypothetical protein RJA70_824 [Pseudomonadota bacterium]|jgi:hypothetical protein
MTTETQHAPVRLARRCIIGGAVLGPGGIALALLGHPAVGAWLVVASGLVGIFGLHKLGRSGRDASS